MFVMEVFKVFKVIIIILCKKIDKIDKIKLTYTNSLFLPMYIISHIYIYIYVYVNIYIPRHVLYLSNSSVKKINNASANVLTSKL